VSIRNSKDLLRTLIGLGYTINDVFLRQPPADWGPDRLALQNSGNKRLWSWPGSWYAGVILPSLCWSSS